MFATAKNSHQPVRDSIAASSDATYVRARPLSTSLAVSPRSLAAVIGTYPSDRPSLLPMAPVYHVTRRCQQLVADVPTKPQT
jgi:hypothetical protein